MATSFYPVGLGVRSPDLAQTLLAAEQIRSAELARRTAARREEQENAIAQLLGAQAPALVGSDPEARRSALAQLMAFGAPGAQLAAPFVQAQLQAEANQETPLSPAEARALGLPAGSVATRTASGGVRVLYTPPQYGPETFSTTPVEVEIDGKRQLALIGTRGSVRFLPPGMSLESMKTGLQPVPVMDAQGRITVAFPDGRGGLVPARMPEGYSYAPRTREINAGDEYVILDQAGRPVGAIPRNMIGAKIDEELGKGLGAQMASADTRLSTADDILATIDRTLNHPALEGATGLLSEVLTKIRGTNMHDFQTLYDQVSSQAFLLAFDRLRGGGQITEREGEAARQALMRARTTQSASAFRQALQEFRDFVEKGREAALRDMAAREERLRRVGMGAPESGGAQREPSAPGVGVPRPTERFRFNPGLGRLERVE